MKTILFLLVISLVAWAQENTLKIDQVKAVDYQDETATITFMRDDQYFYLPTNSSVLPCLDNAWKAEKQVVLLMHKDGKRILECKLYGGGYPTNF